MGIEHDAATLDHVLRSVRNPHDRERSDREVKRLRAECATLLARAEEAERERDAVTTEMADEAADPNATAAFAPGWRTGDRVQFGAAFDRPVFGTVVGFVAPEWMVVRLDGQAEDSRFSMPHPSIQPAKKPATRKRTLTLTHDEVSTLLEGWVEKDKYGEADRIWDRMLRFVQSPLSADEFYALHTDGEP